VLCCRQFIAEKEASMSQLYAGLDVSLELTSICVVDAEGRLVYEDQVASDPEAIGGALGRCDGMFERIGFEAGPLSQWLYFRLRDAGFPSVCIEARHAKAAMAAMNRNKNDRNDARSLAQLIRSGWFKKVHVKSAQSQELRTLLVAREFFVNKLRDHENEIRGLLRPFGLKVGRVGASAFAARVRELVEGNPRLQLCMDALLKGRTTMLAQLAALHRELLRVTANDELCRRFMTIPGVGPVTALAFKTAIDDPARFRRSNDVGAHLGLTPRQYQSGETDVRGRISRSGDAFARTALFTAAHVMMTRSRQWTSIKAWGMRIAQRSSLKKAKIAVARKLAVIMHRMWRDATPFRWGAAA
jgi:transposase